MSFRVKTLDDIIDKWSHEKRDEDDHEWQQKKIWPQPGQRWPQPESACLGGHDSRHRGGSYKSSLSSHRACSSRQSDGAGARVGDDLSPTMLVKESELAACLCRDALTGQIVD